MARASLGKTVYAEAEAAHHTLPEACPFNTNRDRLLFDETNKIMYSHSRFTCRLCNKSFRGETYIDQHFQNRHNRSVAEVGPRLAASAVDEHLRD